MIQHTTKCVYIYIYTYVYTYTHIYIHTYIHTPCDNTNNSNKTKTNKM